MPVNRTFSISWWHKNDWKSHIRKKIITNRIVCNQKDFHRRIHTPRMYSLAKLLKMPTAQHAKQNKKKNHVAPYYFAISIDIFRIECVESFCSNWSGVNWFFEIFFSIRLLQKFVCNVILLENIMGFNSLPAKIMTYT